jgi:serine protease inhibitor
MKTFSAIAILLLALVALAEEPEKIPNELVEGNNTFALELYSKLSAGKENLFFSPYSISAALAMTYAGARGETGKQMAKTLHFVSKNLHTDFAELNKMFNADGKSYELNMANALWTQTGYQIRKEFLDITKEKYGAGFFEVDFQKEAEKVASLINIWVSESTKDKIKSIVIENTFNKDTRFVLTNAIYFKAAWDSKFYEENTKNMPFQLLSGEKVQVPMMNQTIESAYGENIDYQILLLPYKDYEIFMTIILPKKPDGIKNIEKSINYQKIKKALDSLECREVILTFPKFEIESTFELSSPLGDIGIKDAFNINKADFSGITGNRDLFISRIMHKTYIKVDEKGTEAAAATVIEKTKGKEIDERKPVVFKADHPFMFIITDTTSDSILFIGRIMDPRKEEF